MVRLYKYLNRKYKSTLVLFLLLPQMVLAQDLTFRNISVEDGLSNNFVTAINQDSRGYMWFGTLDGLDRFDGSEIRSYANKFPGHPVKVNRIINDPKQGIWVGTDMGLFYWDFIAEKFQEVRLSGKPVAVTSLQFLPGDSILFAGTSQGLWLYHTESTESRIVELPDNTNEMIQVTDAQSDGIHLWVTTTSNLIKIKIADFSIQTFRNEESAPAYNNFTSLVVFNDTILLGTQTRGLFIFDPIKQDFSSFADIGNRSIYVLEYDQKGSLYVGTDGDGFIVLDLNDYTYQSYREHVSYPYSLNSNAVYSMYIDRHGRFWIGTYSGGVNYNTTHEGGFQVSVFDNNMFLGQSSMRSLYFDANNDKYIGTRSGIYISKQNGETFHFNKDNSLLESNVILALKKHEDQILLGTFRGGAAKYHTQTNKLEPFENGILPATGSVYGFEHDREGNLFIATMEGLYVKDVKTGELHHFTTSNTELEDHRLISILYDSNGRLWLGSIGAGTSVFEWKDFELKQADQNLDLSKYKAVSFFEDSNRNVWISTEHEGLVKIISTLDEKFIYTEENGLPNNSVSAITEAPRGIYWITTLKGFSRFEQESANFKNFTLSHGLPGLVFNRGSIVNNYTKDKRIWLGTENGLVSFNPDVIDKNKPDEKVIFTDAFVEGSLLLPAELQKPIEEVETLTFEGNQSGIGFRFIALNYFNTIDNAYEYRLSGLEKEWQKSTNNFVNYTNIKPGKYTFQVQLAGYPSSMASIDIVIKPHWYQHALFKILIGLIIILIIAGTGKLIYELKRNVHQVREEKDAVKENQVKYGTSHLSTERSKEIEVLLKEHVEASKIYLNPDLNLQSLAAAIDCPPHDVSQVLNQNLNQSYYEFINRYRIEAVKKHMADPAYKKYTLLAIAQECGYNSKTSFYRAFKKLTGLTPIQYQNQLDKSPA